MEVKEKHFYAIMYIQKD